MLGLPDFSKIVPDALKQAQAAAQAAGITIEDHAIQDLTPFLSNALAEATADLLKVEGPIVAEIQALRKMLEGPCAALTILMLNGLQITPHAGNSPIAAPGPFSPIAAPLNT